MMRAFHTLRRYQRLLARYLRPERARMLGLGAILMLTIAVQAATPWVTSRFIDRAIGGGASRTLLLLALLTIGLGLAGQGLGVVETFIAENVSWAATNALRIDLATHLLKLDAGFHSAHSPGELIERVDGDVSTLARFFSRFVVYVIGNGLLLLGMIALLFSVDWRVGAGLSVFVVVALAAMVRIRAASTPMWAADRQANADFYGFLGEYLDGAEDVRSSGAVPFVMRRCAELMRSWLAITLKAQMRGYALIATSEGLFGLGTVTAIGVSIHLYRSDSLSIGAIYLIVRCTDMLREPTERIRNELQDFQQADASIQRIEALLATVPGMVDGEGGELSAGPLSVELDGVSFGYAEDVPVLSDVTVRLEPGRVLGVIGRTGSGKTTLTRLLPRFYDPQRGSVRIGGVDVRSVPLAELRGRIGIVTQDVRLFNASVRDNLTLFDDRVPDAELIAVLDALGLGVWLRELPEGLDTRIGAGGSGLSAGQAQVLACARVFLRDPDLVILDEASSRLDPATERLVHAALERLLAGRTGVIVAHRLSTIAFADEVLVLERGRVQEHGERIALMNDPMSRFAGLLRTAGEELAR